MQYKVVADHECVPLDEREGSLDEHFASVWGHVHVL